MSEVALVSNDEGDWMGVYIDGRLVYENHSIDEDHLLDLLGIEYTRVTDVDCEQYGGSLPNTWPLSWKRAGDAQE